jgi:trigger factor
MKVQVEEISPVKRRIDVEIPADRVRSEYERAYQSVSRRAQIKGFRRGRVPRPVLERYFSEEVRGEVTSKLVREGFATALDESKLAIVAPPDLDVSPSGETEPLRFSATVEILPEIGAVETTGLSASRPRVVVADEDVDRILEQLRMRNAQLVPIEDRQDLARGDFATVDITAKHGDRVIPELTVESATVEVAGGHLPPAVDERLALARVGETFQAEGPAPGGAPEELRDQTLQFEVAVRGIATRWLPELDDEFAKDFGAGETLAALRERIGEDLRRDGQRRSDAAVREAILDELFRRHPVDLPQSLVSGRIDELLHDFKHELASRGLQLTSATHEDEAREKLRPRAERDVHARLLLDRIGAQLGIEVADEEVAEQIGKLLAAAGQHREHLRERYAEPYVRDALRSDLRRTRTLERLIGSADVTEVEPRVE